MAIAIVDDDPRAACVTKMTIEDANLETFQVEPDPAVPKMGKQKGLLYIASKILDQADAAVCDHRLRPGGYAGFDGAELAAHLIKNKLPAVLISQFVDQDYDVSIRHWRAVLPSVLSRDEFRVDTFKEGLEVCRNEIKGVFSPQRRRHRVLVRVVDIQHEAHQKVIDGIIPAWSRRTAVRFPFAIIPKQLHSKISIKSLLIANVNLGANRPEDLFLIDFEIPPTPEDGLFNNI